VATQKPTVSVILEEEMLKKIDDYQFNNRIQSRSKALNEIIRLGMEALESKQQEENNKE